jgi:hypothetical protein
MENKGYSTIPRILFESITFLARVLPVRSAPTFIELLIGAMLTQAGFVTEAWLAINPLRSWGAYYKWLQQGKWSWVALGVQLAQLVVISFPQTVWFLIFDDTFIYRSSRKAPGSGIYHQHGNKTNRPQYARGQNWVTMALSIAGSKKYAAIPLLSRLMRLGGNTGKLQAAKTLLRVIAPVFAGQEKKKTFCLVDSWFMKWPFLKYVLEAGFHAIGQVRKDTALYGIPIATGKRGRPRKYGDKFTPEVVQSLPVHRKQLLLYGRKQWVRYRTAVCKAKFLKGHTVRAVWVQFEDDQGNLSGQRLFLSTLHTLSAEEILQYYSRRWSIEPLFNQMKNSWGWNDAWQQSRQVLHRWTQILSVSYALPQLLATCCSDQVEGLIHLTPWRKKNQITAGRVRQGLQRILGNVRVRDWWNPTCRIFQPPGSNGTETNKGSGPGKQEYMMSKSNMVEQNPPPS